MVPKTLCDHENIYAFIGKYLNTTQNEDNSNAVRMELADSQYYPDAER